MSNHILEVQNLDFSAGEMKILSNLNCQVSSGEMVGIIGPNGCGKTTFFNCLSGFNSCNVGKIIFQGKNITKLAAHKRALLGLGRVFQNFGVFRDMTVLENIILAIETRQNPISTFFPWAPKHKENRARAMEILELGGLEHKALRRAGSLSGGQMRLLEIVRLMAFQAELLLLDEPTSGVSPKMKEHVAELILKLKDLGKTVMIIEHDMAFIQKFCQRILVMDEGTVILDDEPEKVRSNPMLHEIYFGNGG